jgi:hypothetical protein
MHSCRRASRPSALFRRPRRRCFAICSLAEDPTAPGTARSLDLARRTLELLEQGCADPTHGGCLENFEADWMPSAPASRAAT